MSHHIASSTTQLGRSASYIVSMLCEVVNFIVEETHSLMAATHSPRTNKSTSISSDPCKRSMLESLVLHLSPSISLPSTPRTRISD